MIKRKRAHRIVMKCLIYKKRQYCVSYKNPDTPYCSRDCHDRQTFTLVKMRSVVRDTVLITYVYNSTGVINTGDHRSLAQSATTDNVWWSEQLSGRSTNSVRLLACESVKTYR